MKSRLYIIYYLSLFIQHYVYCFFFIVLIFGSITSLEARYPSSTSMLTKVNNKYYLKNTGELFSGQIVNMSQKTWKKILETHLINGEIDGLYREWYPNGVLKHEGNFAKGKREGKFYSWYPNGKKMHVFKYENNVLDSISVSYLENGMVKKKHDHDTDLAYIWDFSESPKSLSRYTEQFGKLNGDYIKWDQFGRKVEEGHYNKDKKDSIWFKYNSEGLIFEKGRFKNDLKEGVWSNLDQYGRTSSKSYFNQGTLDSIKNILYFMDGKEYVIKNYKVHSRENMVVTFNKNGGKISTTTYIGSSLTGESVKWFNNGQIEYKLNFVNNKLDGIAEYWNQDGSKNKSGEFKEGKIIGDWTYFQKTDLDSNFNPLK